jgi:hypothetical protein
MTSVTYETATPHGCRFGHTYADHTRGDPKAALQMIVPDGAGLTPGCVVCGEPLVPTGAERVGRWELIICCSPGRDGKWWGPPRDPHRCISCFGTQKRAQCMICGITNCDGVHNFCIDCDGEKRVTCTDCDGSGLADPAVDDPKDSPPCPTCNGKETVTCPACGGTGKPGKEQRDAAAALARRGAKPVSTAPASTSTARPSTSTGAAPAMPGRNIDEAQDTVIAQAQRLEAVVTNSEQLENDLVAGGLGADDLTLSKVRGATELTASAAQAWRAVDTGLGGHATGVGYARSGIAAKTSFLQG